jgi:septal ring factor EnvC (AmiA/AmiB activator)
MSSNDELTDEQRGLKERVARGGEEAIGRLAQELLENRLIAGAISAAFETRERALRAQEVAMGALNLPSASDIERLTRRLRLVSQRLEGVEDAVERLEARLAKLDAIAGLERRLAAIEQALERISERLERPPA